MKTKIILLSLAVVLCGCNSIHMQPNSLTPNATVYTTRGGYTLRPAIKELMQERGYEIKIGKITDSDNMFENGIFEGEIFDIPESAQYILRVSENSERFRPIWCAFNGFWWWRFYVSIVDQHNSKEILTWTGRGCANSTIRKMENILDKLEETHNEQ